MYTFSGCIELPLLPELFNPSLWLAARDILELFLGCLLVAAKSASHVYVKHGQHKRASALRHMCGQQQSDGIWKVAVGAVVSESRRICCIRVVGCGFCCFFCSRLPFAVDG